MQYRCYCFLLFFALIAFPTSAQITPKIGINFITMAPQGEFAEHVDQTGFGGSLWGGVRLGTSPVFIGVDLGIAVYGHKKRTEPFSPSIPEVRVDVVTTNNIFNGYLLVRLQPPSGKILPYLDGLIGARYLFTRTRVQGDAGDEDGTLASTTNFDDTTLSYGFGGGLEVQLYQGASHSEKPKVYTIYLNLGVRYLFGGEARYLNEGDLIRTEHASLQFDEKHSKTSLLQPQIGITFQFE